MTFRTRASLTAFAFTLACTAVPASTTAEGTATVGLGEPARFGAIAVTPLRIDEDSRCPENVQCVHAGTVRLAVGIAGRRASREAVLHLRTPLDLGDGSWLTLAAVCPYPRVPGRIARSSYRFALTVAADSAAPAREVAC